MKKYNGEEYWDKLSSMSKLQLMRECTKLHKRLNKLSSICDVEDTYKIMQENFELNRKAIRADKADAIILKEIDNLGASYDKRNRVDVHAQQLIDLLKR